jgi:hypothetical protein
MEIRTFDEKKPDWEDDIEDVALRGRFDFL